MIVFLRLAFKSIWLRKETVSLAIFSLALSIFLLLCVERLRQSAEEGFTQTISQTDLVVGARTGPTNLILATVFNRGVFTNNIKTSTYEYWRSKDAVEWIIPLALGDGHRGYRVVGTTDDFYKHYHYQVLQSLKLGSGTWTEKPMDVVIGAEVARALHYELGQKVVIDHGVTREAGMLHHDDHPFQVSGILEATGTIIDQSLFLSLASLEAIHEGHHEGELEDHHADHKDNHKDDHVGDKHLTAFFLKLKNRIDVLNLQREINNYEGEPLSAVIPSVVVNDIWHMFSYVENALRVLGFCILLVSLLSMIGILMATLNERRREMAILRALGAGPRRLAGLLVWESFLVTTIAVILGWCLQITVVGLFQNWLKEKYGLFLETFQVTAPELFYLAIIVLLGTLIGLWPAIRVYRSSLKDGLIVK